MKSKIRIVLIDYQKIVRCAINSLLGQTENMQVLGQGNSFEDAVYLCDIHQPDILLCDFFAGDERDLSQLVRFQKQFPDLKIFVFTRLGNASFVRELMLLGVVACWFKNARIEPLLNAIEAVSQGQISLDPEALRSIIGTLDDVLNPGFDLTEREREVLGYIARGYTNRRIALALHISYSTVKNHVSNILSKLEVSNRVEAATYETKVNSPKTRERGMLSQHQTLKII